MRKATKTKGVAESIKVPIIFESKSPYLRLVNPNNVPRHDKKTGEGIWGEVVVFDECNYVCRSLAQARWVMKHPSYLSDFWIKGQRPATAFSEKVVDMVTIPHSPAVSDKPPRD